ncbi:MAG: NAD(P)/FAD-dependent oxidoreductase [Bacteroidota bacterium]|nr:NAD(P)/FAD-dependent oxidoreductase [Bacteroidota bacterium]MDP4218390.1 NAD(P)/FAD-dependent oxidoreductase [Bacteroidota bacterium]MDP4245832.1 NAD(P)/FAD-dependent oxidoreductase [Bacteroidota bacterium]MDP4252652.1 NAD(P)/FAD-dependent oxidoreductase [Bacteroidota bacterium]MDP4256675.1 NAD(P)/FAD-dependent oxidoreductase [Bacteroidota bacterium]
MSSMPSKYDVLVAGGGLAGLSLSIQLARAGYSVVLFEKEKYPFHRVCGEYISLESWNFLEDLGLPLSDWSLPVIKRILVSAPNGDHIEQDLPLGGFGISRYKIDAALAAIARSSGVTLYESTRVEATFFERSRFRFRTSGGEFEGRMACGTFGKRSNLDISWRRPFIRERATRLNNYVAVKYHVRPVAGAEERFPADQIVLHNFRNGYCGMSKIEDGKYCLCYLTTAKNLKDSGNSIPEMEKNILRQNPYLKQLFSSTHPLFDQPLSIAQISFERKSQVEEHLLMVGDAAGMITPLSGNGMSMALHGSKIAFRCMDSFLRDQVARHEMEQEYQDLWNKQFGKRLWTGRLLQRFFGSESGSNFLINSLKHFPGVVSFLIRQTHGQPF